MTITTARIGSTVRGRTGPRRLLGAGSRVAAGIAAAVALVLVPTGTAMAAPEDVRTIHSDDGTLSLQVDLAAFGVAPGSEASWEELNAAADQAAGQVLAITGYWLYERSGDGRALSHELQRLQAALAGGGGAALADTGLSTFLDDFFRTGCRARCLQPSVTRQILLPVVAAAVPGTIGVLTGHPFVGISVGVSLTAVVALINYLFEIRDRSGAALADATFRRAVTATFQAMSIAIDELRRTDRNLGDRLDDIEMQASSGYESAGSHRSIELRR